MGIGNPLRSDDGVGSLLIQELGQYDLPKNVKLFNCEIVPENFTRLIKKFKPTHVILVDSAQLNEKPGTVKLVSPTKIGGIAFSTHTLPLTFLIRYLKEVSRAKIVLLAIQPKNIDFGSELTPELKDTLNKLTLLMKKIFQVKNP